MRLSRSGLAQRSVLRRRPAGDPGRKRTDTFLRIFGVCLGGGLGSLQAAGIREAHPELSDYCTGLDANGLSVLALIRQDKELILPKLSDVTVTESGLERYADEFADTDPQELAGVVRQAVKFIERCIEATSEGNHVLIVIG